jgi:hypothetical protein
MVKFDDLMIGNDVIAYDEIQEVKLLDEERDSIWIFGLVSRITDETQSSRVFPIELTKEWLVKLGFEYYEPLDHWRIINNEDWFEVFGRDGFYWFTFSNIHREEYKMMPARKVQYVHHLQNLFYCLSGRKLKLINE